MQWLTNLIYNPSVAHDILILSLVAASGIALGTIRFFGITMGIAGVLFTGLFFGHFGFHIQPDTLGFVQDFGLILFVYTIGLQVGPGFADSLKRRRLAPEPSGGRHCAVGRGDRRADRQVRPRTDCRSSSECSPERPLTPPAWLPRARPCATCLAMGKRWPNRPGLGYAIAYPFGVIGIIGSMLLLRKALGIDLKWESNILTRLRRRGLRRVIRMGIEVTNPNLIGMPVGEIPLLKELNIILSRIWHEERVQVASSTVKLSAGDVLLAVGTQQDLERLRVVVGRKSDLDLLNMTSEITSQRLIVTKKAVIGKTIGELGMFHRHGARITRVSRTDIEFTAQPDFKLQFGDTVLVVGDPSAIANVAKELGNSPKALTHPEIIPVFVGIILGVVLGSWPIAFPGMPAPVKLGLAGGPLVVAILLSSVGRVGPLVYHMPLSANFIMRELGIVLFLSCVGLKSGDRFVETLVQGDGFYWMGLAAIITVVPLLTFALIGRLCLKVNFLSLCGLMAGSMTDPPALAFAGTVTGSEAPSIAYATVYPLTMILRVLCAQLIVILFMH